MSKNLHLPFHPKAEVSIVTKISRYTDYRMTREFQKWFKDFELTQN